MKNPRLWNKKRTFDRAELRRLRLELACAYDTISGFYIWYQQVNGHTDFPLGYLRLFIVYHGLTIGAARRFKKSGRLDGARYFRERGPEALQKALAA